MAAQMDIDIYHRIQEAEYVLIGIGQEFEELRKLKQIKNYKEKRENLVEEGLSWCIPVMNHAFLRKQEDDRKTALNKLTCMLQGKNYFVVSTVTDPCLNDCELDQSHLVSPCGGTWGKQCNCSRMIKETTKQEIQKLEACVYENNWKDINLDICPDCGQPYTLNNIYTENYDESGYLEQWQKYTKWLQSTLNRKLVVLELGVGMEYPSVIRWPFEKVVYYNQKAFLIRVNEKIYHLTEEIKDRGKSAAQNAVDWLAEKAINNY